MISQRSAQRLAALSIALWGVVVVLCLVGWDTWAAVAAGVGFVQTVGSFAFWLRGRRVAARQAERITLSAAAAYMSTRERVVAEMDTCRFPRWPAAEPPVGFAAIPEPSAIPEPAMAMSGGHRSPKYRETQAYWSAFGDVMETVFEPREDDPA